MELEPSRLSAKADLVEVDNDDEPHVVSWYYP